MSCRQDSLKRVLGSKKLLLVLDLDHTLLNSTRIDEVSLRLPMTPLQLMSEGTLVSRGVLIDIPACR